MRQDLDERVRMVYTGDDGHEIFVSHAWRRLFEIRAPLFHDFILEFLSTCRIGNKMGLDAADTLCFQLGGARRSMTWRQFFLALGLHTAEKMAKDGFEALVGEDFLRASPSYTYIRDSLRRLCHRHTKGSKSGARLSRGHFIRRLAHHFGLVSDDGLGILSVVTRELLVIDMGELVKLNICMEVGDDWAWVAQGAERQPVDAATALGGDEVTPDVDEGLKATPIVRRPLNRDSSFKDSVLSKTKKSSKKVEVYDKANTKTDLASTNVVLNKNIVTDVDVKTLLKQRMYCVFRMLKMCLSRVMINVLRIITSMCIQKLEEPSSLRLEQQNLLDKTKIAAVTPLSAKNKVVQIVLWILDSGYSKHMTGDLSLLEYFVEKFMGIVRFRNDHFAAITGYGDYVHCNITFCHVYYVEGLGHNLFSVVKFYDGDLEVAFRFKTCRVRNLKGDDLLTGARESNFYTISIFDMTASLPVCRLSKATSTKSWLWHCRLLHLNFDTVNDLTNHDLVDSLSKFKYCKDHLCSA
nr:integrase, catalytic region, zinc finger, CCHC-type, peptidase aspartic, catalytic [Tanacetum cinerariifolium]